MPHPAIKVEGLWKEYLVGSAQQRHTTFYDLLASAVQTPRNRLRRLGGQAPEAERFWALRDISFEVQPGEVVGIIGRNGAGKSTLLKVLSRITAPTRGRVEVRGRLASLLEVGTGFHPELTGRENIFLNGAILGMSRGEIARKFDEIVAFAEVETFIDTPVKRYSSGMYVRLAFAVAAHLDSDVMLVDEVLAVGDVDFQKKCLGMMGEASREGRTVVFVSHNLTAIRNLCSVGLLLKTGDLARLGDIGDVLARYISRPSSAANSVDLVGATPGVHPACVRRVSVETLPHWETEPLTVNTPFLIKIAVEIARDNADVGVFVHCWNSDGIQVFSSGSFFSESLRKTRLSAGIAEYSCHVPGRLLNNDEYTVDVMLTDGRGKVFEKRYGIFSFRLLDAPLGIEGWHWRPKGVIRPDLLWDYKRAT